MNEAFRLCFRPDHYNAHCNVSMIEVHRIDSHVLLPRSYGRSFIPGHIAANLVFCVTPMPLGQTVIGGGAPIWHFRGGSGDKPGSQGLRRPGLMPLQPGGGAGRGSRELQLVDLMLRW